MFREKNSETQALSNAYISAWSDWIWMLQVALDFQKNVLERLILPKIKSTKKYSQNIVSTRTTTT